MRIERIAPSPTGKLHLGHAFSMLKVSNNIKKYGGIIKLRIDDLDFLRCNEKYIDDILINIKWLKIPIEKKVYKQTKNYAYYKKSLKKLEKLGLLYKCNCTRKDINEFLSAPHNKNNLLNENTYPEICKNKKIKNKNFSLRIDLKKSLDLINEEDLYFIEEGYGPKGEHGKQKFSKKFLAENFGDIILARKDINSSYNLAVVIDDSLQKITHVTRGNDLFEITKIQTLLQLILNLPRKTYHHHKLIRDKYGKKLSKRNMPNSLKNIRENMELKDLYKILNLNTF